MLRGKHLGLVVRDPEDPFQRTGTLTNVLTLEAHSLALTLEHPVKEVLRLCTTTKLSPVVIETVAG